MQINLGKMLEPWSYAWTYTFIVKVIGALNYVIFPAQQYQRLFTFPFFNIVQSQVLDDVSYTIIQCLYDAFFIMRPPH